MGNEYSDMLTFFGTNNDSVLPFLQAALDAMTAHIAILDGQGVIIAVNSAWVNYARDNDLSLREYGVGENYCDVCRPAADANDLDAVTISAAIREILTDKHPKQFRYEYLCAYPGDPTRDRWFHLSLQPFLLGELRFIVMSHEDITQKHLAERSRNLLEQAVAQIRSGVVITDQSGTIEYANAAFSHICGYPIDELIGKNPRLLKSGRIPRATYETLWSSISRGETWRGRVCNRRKDGSYYWEEQTISPVRDPAGVITHYVAVKEDVTEAHRRDLLHAGMLRAASDAFLVFDSNGRIVEWSPQAASLFGVSVHKAKGSAFSQIVFEAELAAEFDRELEIFAATGNCRLIGRPMRLLMKNGDGERFTAELSITAVNMDDDWRFTGFIRDLTAAIHTEQQLVQAQKMEAIGQLTGGMAHDFNNLLGIMSGSLDLLSGSLTGTGPGAAIQDKYLRIARDTTKRAAEITKSLMAVARRRPLNPIVMNINAAINELAPLIHQSAGKRITVDIFTSAELPQVRIEPTSQLRNSRVKAPNGRRDSSSET